MGRGGCDGQLRDIHAGRRQVYFISFYFTHTVKGLCQLTNLPAQMFSPQPLMLLSLSLKGGTYLVDCLHNTVCLGSEQLQGVQLGAVVWLDV